MFNGLIKTKENTHIEHSNYTGVVVLYLVSAVVAATLILPVEESILAGVIKSTIWPLYLLTKILGA